MKRLGDQNARLIPWICEGKIVTNEFSSFPEISVPDDLYFLWSIMNGLSEPEGTTYEFIWLDGVYMFYSIDQSAQDYQISSDLMKSDENFTDYWPKGFLPIGSPGDGSRLLVNCNEKSHAYGSVYELFHGDGITFICNSLADYFEGRNEYLDAGIIRVLGSGEVEMDFERVDEIVSNDKNGASFFSRLFGKK